MLVELSTGGAVALKGTSMLIAIPSDAPGGLQASISEHFGHCEAFTLVQVQDGQVGDVTVLLNGGHEHGGCMAPVMLLHEHQVNSVVAGGMGMRPLAGFQQVGIEVYTKGEAVTVEDAVQQMIGGHCQPFANGEACGGGCSGDGHAHHVERAPIEGRADVREGRVVSLHLTLTEVDGEQIETTEGANPMQYLHGRGSLPAVLEKALDGLEAGAQKRIQVAAADAYGERDEGRVLEIPRDKLPADVSVGSVLRAQDPSGDALRLRVMELGSNTARLDGNHPLAGKDLLFDVTVVAVESATEQELEHGHVH